MRILRRITVLLDLLVHHVPVAVVCERWGLSPSCLYDWQRAFMLHGMDSLRYRHSGGAPREVDAQPEKTLGRVDRGRSPGGGL